MRKASKLLYLVPILVAIGIGLAIYRPTSCSAACKAGKDQLTAIHLPRNWSVEVKLGFAAASESNRNPWNIWTEEFIVKGTPKQAMGQFDAAAKAAGWQVAPRCNPQGSWVTGCWRKPSAGYKINAEAADVGRGVLVKILMSDDHAVR
jgi:hypothetical protein